MITPIIMEGNIEEVAKKLSFLREQKIDRVHIDIGDGLFSDLLSIAPADLQQVDLIEFKSDIHLLVDDPTEWIPESVALKPARVIGQIERMGSQMAFLERVGGYGMAGGLALKIETPIEEIEEEALEKTKVILLLAVPAGTSGSLFDKRVIEKIGELRKVYHGSILIDGGINKGTYKQIIDAGASETGANSAWWRGDFNGQK